MVSRFDADFAAGGLPELLYQFGEAATYSPVGRPDVSLTAILGAESSVVETMGGIRAATRTRMATITNDPTSDYGGVTSANESATFKIGDEVWAIESTSEAPDSWVLSLTRPELTEIGRPGYRGGMP